MLVFEDRRKPDYKRKTSRSKGESQQQTQPTYGVNAGIWTQATMVGGECSHPCTTHASQNNLLMFWNCSLEKRLKQNPGLHLPALPRRWTTLAWDVQFVTKQDT